MNKKTLTSVALASMIGVSTLATPVLPIPLTNAQSSTVQAATLTQPNAQQKWVLDGINKIRIKHKV